MDVKANYWLITDELVLQLELSCRCYKPLGIPLKQVAIAGI